MKDDPKIWKSLEFEYLDKKVWKNLDFYTKFMKKLEIV